MEIVDIATFIEGEILIEREFTEKVSAYDWETLRGKKVLVRGCGDTPIPTWAYMLITGKLADVADKVRYGNEHSNIVVYRKPG